MPDGRRTRCKVCGGHKSEVGPISWRGKCATHGVEAQASAIFQLANHSGPVFEYWRYRTAASVGAILPNPTETD